MDIPAERPLNAVAKTAPRKIAAQKELSDIVTVDYQTFYDNYLTPITKMKYFDEPNSPHHIGYLSHIIFRRTPILSEIQSFQFVSKLAKRLLKGKEVKYHYSGDYQKLGYTGSDPSDIAFCAHTGCGLIDMTGRYSMNAYGAVGFYVFSDTLMNKINSPGIGTETLEKLHNEMCELDNEIEESENADKEERKELMDKLIVTNQVIKKVNGMPLQNFIKSRKLGFSTIETSIESIYDVRKGEFADDPIMGIRVVQLLPDGNLTSLPIKLEDVRYLVHHKTNCGLLDTDRLNARPYAVLIGAKK
jgi:hypothetical protein